MVLFLIFLERLTWLLLRLLLLVFWALFEIVVRKRLSVL